MNLTTFFELVLPTTGYLILAEPLETKGYRHHIFEDEQAAINKAVDLNFDHKNVFFALAGFRAPKVWNPNAKAFDGSLGKWQTRTQANAGWLRSLFLDLDIDPAPATPEKAGKVYTTRTEAITDLNAFVKKLGLPAPMVVDSGGGWHVYWPFDDDVTKDEWQPIADKFKAICLSEGMKIDPAVPSDAARVLRPVGCHNLKRDQAREVAVFTEGDGPTPVGHLKLLLDTYEQNNGISIPRKQYSAPTSSSYSNIGRDFDPLDFGLISFGCMVIGGQVACGGKGTSEPLWRAVVGIAKHAPNARAALLSVSDQHENFSEDEMLAKADRWNAGPTTCNYFKNNLGCVECQSCPHKLTSPAQLGRMKEEADAPVERVINPETGVEEEIEIIQPPAPYIRHLNKSTGLNEIVMKCEDKDGNPYHQPVSPNDFYPIRILRNTVAGEISECTLWKFHLPRLQPFTAEIRQSMLGDTKGLQALLNNAGIYAHTDQIKAIQVYMSAYLKHLAQERDREKVYTRLGWQFGGKDDVERVGYVVGQRHFNMDGTIAACNLSQGVKNATNNGLHPKGAQDEWTKFIDTHYKDDIYQAHRFFIYCSFAAPLLHLTGEKGALVTASGKSGRGKTTVLRAGASVWGHPDGLILNGNPQGATANATENHLGTIHSLPMMWDDTTNLESKKILEFALNVSQGKGKQRMKGNEHDGRSVSWETMVLSSTNYDTMTQALAGQIATDAHLMRIISVPFDKFNDTTAAALGAEEFKRGLYANYGLAGIPFMQYVTANYKDVQARVVAAEKQAWQDFNGHGHERFWMKIIGAVKVAMEIVDELGLLHFDIKADYLWMGSHVGEMRAMHQEFKVDPVEELSAFLEERISETLVMSSKATSNLDNVAHMPQRQLTIRHEMDHGLIYVSKAEVGKYCAEKNESIRTWEDQLIAAGVLVDRGKQKTLGADTKLAKGQVRCWVLDANRLGARFVAAVQNAVSNVVPLAPTGT